MDARNRVELIGLISIVLVLGGARQVEAVIIFDNYEADETLNSGGTPAYFNNPGFAVEIGNAFTPALGDDYLLDKIELSLLGGGFDPSNPPPLDVDVFLRSDVAGSPDGILESFHLHVEPYPASSIHKFTFDSIAQPLLADGQQYWLTLVPTELGQYVAWASNFDEFGGPKADRQIHDGVWRVFNFQTTKKNLFRITGTSDSNEPVVPEPSSLLLLSSGLLGLAGLRRRRA